VGWGGEGAERGERVTHEIYNKQEISSKLNPILQIVMYLDSLITHSLVTSIYTLYSF